MFLGGMKLIDIAKQLNLPEGTVRRWKSTHRWKNERSNEESERSDKRHNEKKKAIAEEIDQVIENPDLTDKQRLFCLYYIRCFNATKAAVKAGYSRDTAMEQGYQLLQKTSVREEIQRLKQNRLNRELLDESDIFQKYMDIAFADITDFAEINGGMLHVKSDLDGTLVSELSDTANGIKVKLADRMKALQWLGDHMDLATDEQRARIKALNAQTAVVEDKKARENGSAEAIAENIQTLADILQHSRQNRNVEEFEE